MKTCVFVLLLAITASFATASDIKIKSSPEGIALFKQSNFTLQCWQEGEKIIDEKGLGAINSTAEIIEQRLSFLQSENGKKVMIVTLGRSLCMAKSAQR